MRLVTILYLAIPALGNLILRNAHHYGHQNTLVAQRSYQFLHTRDVLRSYDYEDEEEVEEEEVDDDDDDDVDNDINDGYQILAREMEDHLEIRGGADKKAIEIAGYAGKAWRSYRKQQDTAAAMKNQPGYAARLQAPYSPPPPGNSLGIRPPFSHSLSPGNPTWGSSFFPRLPSSGGSSGKLANSEASGASKNPSSRWSSLRDKIHEGGLSGPASSGTGSYLLERIHEHSQDDSSPKGSSGDSHLSGRSPADTGKHLNDHP